jgi:hypothetical protein
MMSLRSLLLCNEVTSTRSLSSFHRLHPNTMVCGVLSWSRPKALEGICRRARGLITSNRILLPSVRLSGEKGLSFNRTGRSLHATRYFWIGYIVSLTEAECCECFSRAGLHMNEETFPDTAVNEKLPPPPRQGRMGTLARDKQTQ